MNTSFYALFAIFFQLAAPGLEADVDGPNAEQIYEAGAHWVGEDTVATLATTTDWTFDEVEELVIPFLDPDAEPGTLGTVEGLHTDLIDLVTEVVGFDPTAIDGLMVAAGSDEVSAVVLGDIELPDQLPQVDINDKPAYEIQLPTHAMPMAAGFLPESLYLFPVDDPSPAVVLSGNLEQLEELDAARDAGDDISLANSNNGGHLSELFEHSAGAPFAAALTTAGADGDQGPADALDVDSVVVSLDQGISATIFDDDPQVLDGLTQQVDQGVTMLEGQMEQRYQRDEFADLTDRLTSIYTYHAAQALIAQLEPRRTDTSLGYDVRISPDIPWHVGALTSIILTHGMN